MEISAINDLRVRDRSGFHKLNKRRNLSSLAVKLEREDDNVSIKTGLRCKHDILRDILAYVKEQPRIKTHIMRHCNLSFSQLSFYLQLCLGMGLLAWDISNAGALRITDSGHRLFQVLMLLRGGN